MNPRDDVFWDRTLHELDVSVAELQRAEERLRDAGEDKLSPEWIDRVVGRVTAPPVVPLRVVGAPPRRMRKAAVALGGLLLAAATTYLVWPDGANSHRTMSYAQAVEILARADQPLGHCRSALNKLYRGVKHAVIALRAVRDDPASSESLSSAARAAINHLQGWLRGERQGKVEYPDNALESAAVAAMNTSTPLPERTRQVQRITRMAAGALAAMQEARVVGEAADDRVVLLQNLVRELAR